MKRKWEENGRTVRGGCRQGWREGRARRRTGGAKEARGRSCGIAVQSENLGPQPKCHLSKAARSAVLCPSTVVWAGRPGSHSLGVGFETPCSWLGASCFMRLSPPCSHFVST
jgi:hypothetical protein